MIYLDNSATTKPCPEAVEAVTKEQVAAAARTVQLHSSYFLKGGCR